MKTQILRDKTRIFFEFAAKPFIYLRFSPNFISLLSFFAVILFCYFLSNNSFILASLMILISGFLDTVDGPVARATGRATNFGKFFDRLIDKINDSIITASFIVLGFVDLRLGLYALITMMISTNVSANIEAVLNAKISDAVSLRFLRFLAFIILIPFQKFTLMFIILSIISTYSLVHRFFSAISLSRKG
ncbi:MAG: CDP-alcohol phosphatidyltransferase family protein [Candidatus Nanoarchaeia archaeon]|nr:CDP-alcohol phosphatidyltransferase family protein [Candidatus Nanoarchaeia archaeon]